MNPDKSAIKLDLLFTQGVVWDDWLESKSVQLHEQTGAIRVLKDAQARIVGPIQEQVAADVESGVVAALEGLALKAYIMKQLERVNLALANMQMNVERERMITEGRAAQLRDVVAFTKKIHDAEAQALTEHRQKVAAGQAADGRPTMTPAEDIAQRRAAARATKDSGDPGLLNQEAAPAVGDVIAPAPEVAVGAVPAKKRAPRKKG